MELDNLTKNNISGTKDKTKQRSGESFRETKGRIRKDREAIFLNSPYIINFFFTRFYALNGIAITNVTDILSFLGPSCKSL